MSPSNIHSSIQGGFVEERAITRQHAKIFYVAFPIPSQRQKNASILVSIERNGYDLFSYHTHLTTTGKWVSPLKIVLGGSYS